MRNRMATTTTSFSRWALVYGCCVCLIGLISSVQSGPVHSRLPRMIINTDESALVQMNIRNETVDDDTCQMEGKPVLRRIVSCQNRPGCRAIQTEGECCPEYQCECKRNGKIYENGEKLVDPDTPCTVCYCQGGEIICSKVSCYNRNDCQPKYLPGRCCPEYDNCPPLESTKIDHSDALETNNVVERTTETLHLTRTTPGVTILQTISTIGNNYIENSNPLGIKIKEITKPEEIRITDEKPKLIPKVMEVNKKEEPAEVEIKTTTETAIEEKSELLDNKDTLRLDDLSVEYNNESDSNKTVRHTEMSEDIDPEKESVPVEMNNITDFVDFSSTTDSILDVIESSSAIIEESQDKKQVFIVDRNGDTKPITVIGAGNLQFGGSDPEEDGGFHDHVVSSSTNAYENSNAFDIESGHEFTEDFNSNFSTTTENDNSVMASTKNEVFVRNADSYDDTPPAEEEDLVFDVKYFGTDQEEPAIDNSSQLLFDTVFYPASNDSLEMNVTDEGFMVGSNNTAVDELDTSVEDTSKIGFNIHGLSTEGPQLEDEELTNPEYPSLPEDVSIHGQQEQQQTDDDHLMVSSTTPKVIEPKVETSFGSYKNQKDDSDEDVEDIPMERSPGEPFLIPEWERANKTNKMDIEDFRVGSQSIEDAPKSSDESKYMDNGEKLIEPTTTKSPNNDYGFISLTGDTVESLNSSESHSRPKEDTESLKMLKGISTEESGSFEGSSEGPTSFEGSAWNVSSTSVEDYNTVEVNSTEEFSGDGEVGFTMPKSSRILVGQPVLRTFWDIVNPF